ncbi:MAG: hypothetical protein PHQ86_05545, partial [Dehalococcoidales bacterium]|nr:hypothetical protein [Dehalococcoidales bacterium]
KEDSVGRIHFNTYLEGKENSFVGPFGGAGEYSTDIKLEGWSVNVSSVMEVNKQQIVERLSSYFEKQIKTNPDLKYIEFKGDIQKNAALKDSEITMIENGDFKGAAREVFKRMNDGGKDIPDSIKAVFNMQGDLKDGWYTWVSGKDSTPNIGEGLDLSNGWTNDPVATSSIEINGKKIAQSTAKVSIADGKFTVAAGQDFKWLTMPVDSSEARGLDNSYENSVTVTGTKSPFVGNFNSDSGIPILLQNAGALSAGNPIIANDKILASGSAQPDVLHFKDYNFKAGSEGDRPALFVGESLRYFGDGGQLSYDNRGVPQYKVGTKTANVFNEPFIGANEANILSITGDNEDVANAISHVYFLGERKAGAEWVAKAQGAFTVLEPVSTDFNKNFKLSTKAIYTESGKVMKDNQKTAILEAGQWNESLHTFTIGLNTEQDNINVLRHSSFAKDTKVLSEKEKTEQLERYKSEADKLNKTGIDLRDRGYHTDLKITGEKYLAEINDDKGNVLAWVETVSGILGMGIDMYGNVRSLAGLPGTHFQIPESRGVRDVANKLINPFYLKKMSSGDNAFYLSVWGGDIYNDPHLGLMGSKGTKFEDVSESKFRKATYTGSGDGFEGKKHEVDVGFEGSITKVGRWENYLTQKVETSRIKGLHREVGLTRVVNKEKVEQAILMKLMPDKKKEILGMSADERKRNLGLFYSEMSRVPKFMEGFSKDVDRAKDALTKDSLAEIAEYIGASSLQDLINNVDYRLEENLDITFSNDASTRHNVFTGKVFDLNNSDIQIANYVLGNLKITNDGQAMTAVVAEGAYWQPSLNVFEKLSGNSGMDFRQMPAARVFVEANEKGGINFKTKESGQLVFDLAQYVPVFYIGGEGTTMSFKKGDIFPTGTRILSEDGKDARVNVEGLVFATNSYDWDGDYNSDGNVIRYEKSSEDKDSPVVPHYYGFTKYVEGKIYGDYSLPKEVLKLFNDDDSSYYYGQGYIDGVIPKDAPLTFKGWMIPNHDNTNFVGTRSSMFDVHGQFKTEGQFQGKNKEVTAYFNEWGSVNSNRVHNARKIVSSGPVLTNGSLIINAVKEDKIITKTSGYSLVFAKLDDRKFGNESSKWSPRDEDYVDVGVKGKSGENKGRSVQVAEVFNISNVLTGTTDKEMPLRNIELRLSSHTYSGYEKEETKHLLVMDNWMSLQHTLNYQNNDLELGGPAMTVLENGAPGGNGLPPMFWHPQSGKALVIRERGADGKWAYRGIHADKDVRQKTAEMVLDRQTGKWIIVESGALKGSGVGDKEVWAYDASRSPDDRWMKRSVDKVYYFHGQNGSDNDGGVNGYIRISAKSMFNSGTSAQRKQLTEWGRDALGAALFEKVKNSSDYYFLVSNDGRDNDWGFWSDDVWLLEGDTRTHQAYEHIDIDYLKNAIRRAGNTSQGPDVDADDTIQWSIGDQYADNIAYRTWGGTIQYTEAHDLLPYLYGKYNTYGNNELLTFIDPLVSTHDHTSAVAWNAGEMSVEAVATVALVFVPFDGPVGEAAAGAKTLDTARKVFGAYRLASTVNKSATAVKVLKIARTAAVGYATWGAVGAGMTYAITGESDAATLVSAYVNSGRVGAVAQPLLSFVVAPTFSPMINATKSSTVGKAVMAQVGRNAVTRTLGRTAALGTLNEGVAQTWNRVNEGKFIGFSTSEDRRTHAVLWAAAGLAGVAPEIAGISKVMNSKSGAKPVAETAKPMAEPVKPVVAETAKPMAAPVKPVVAETAKPMAAPVKPVVAETAKPMAAPVKPVVAETAKPMAEPVKPVVAETAKPIAAPVKPVVVETAKPIAEPVKPVVVETAKPIAEPVKPIVSETAKPIAEPVKPIVSETAKPIAAPVKPVVSETAKPIAAPVKPVVSETAKPIAAPVKPIVYETAKSMTKTVKPGVDNTEPLMSSSNRPSFKRVFKNSASEFIKSTINIAGSTVSGAGLGGEVYLLSGIISDGISGQQITSENLIQHFENGLIVGGLTAAAFSTFGEGARAMQGFNRFMWRNTRNTFPVRNIRYLDIKLNGTLGMLKNGTLSVGTGAVVFPFAKTVLELESAKQMVVGPDGKTREKSSWEIFKDALINNYSDGTNWITGAYLGLGLRYGYAKPGKLPFKGILGETANANVLSKVWTGTGKFMYGGLLGGTTKVGHNWIWGDGGKNIYADFASGFGQGGVATLFITANGKNILNNLKSYTTEGKKESVSMLFKMKELRAANGAELLYNQMLAGAVEWTVVSPAFSVGGALWAEAASRVGLIEKDSEAKDKFMPVQNAITGQWTSLFSEEGLKALWTHSVTGPRSGMWMKPAIEVFQSKTDTPTFYNQGGLVEKAVNTFEKI